MKKKIEEVALKRGDDYSYVWRTTIDDSNQNLGSLTDGTNLPISFFREIVKTQASKGEDSFKKVYNDLSKEKSILLKRISVFLLSEIPELCEDIIEKEIKEKNNYPDINIKREMYQLLESGFKVLDDGSKCEVLKIIDKLEYDWREDLTPEQKESYE